MVHVYTVCCPIFLSFDAVVCHNFLSRVFKSWGCCVHLHLYVKVGHLGVWGELVNLQFTIPVLKAGHLSVLLILCLFVGAVWV